MADASIAIAIATSPFSTLKTLHQFPPFSTSLKILALPTTLPQHFKNRNSFTTFSTKRGIENGNKPLGLESSCPPHRLTTSPPDETLKLTRWTGLVFDLGNKASWDDSEIGSPVVKRFIGDNEERWHMWYHGSSSDPTNASVGLAVSNNGTHWTRKQDEDSEDSDEGLVMRCSKSWWAFDNKSVTPSEMVIISSPMYSPVYWLYYTGYTSERVDCSNYPAGHFPVDAYTSLPGLACSQNGRNWARIEGDHHSGALLELGLQNEWDSLFISKPQVVMHGNDDMRMYYHSFDVESRRFTIGLARSRDGIRWVKMGKIMGGGSKGSFDELGVKNACVVRNRMGGNYLMVYEGVRADERVSIGVAVSPDGLNEWTRVQEVATFSPSGDEGWDNKGVGSPSLVQMEGKVDLWRLYYVGENGRSGIGMAVSEGSDVKSFKRWVEFQS